MKPVRWLGAGLLWIIAGVVGLVGVLLCVTIILLPVGIPLLSLARKLGAGAVALMLPRAVRHPVQELEDKSADTATVVRKKGRRFVGKARKAVAHSLPGESKKLPKKASKPHGRRSGVDRLKGWS